MTRPLASNAGAAANEIANEDTNAKLIANACDCHVHIYEDHYPLAPTATFKPPHAPVSAYREVQRALGLQRVILVQPTGYGADNACLLDALVQLGDGARGIAVVNPDASQAELERLHAAGVRGVRFMLLGAPGPLAWADVAPLAARMAPLGWTVNLQFDGREWPQRKALIDSLPCKVVIDHIGRFVEPVPTTDPAFKALQSVLDRPQRWVKLSAPYETSKVGAPHYSDVAPLARALAASHPHRCLWASNWPHPNRNPVPNEADLLALLSDWVSDAAQRHAMLGANAAAAYAF
jgi:D-galactarolactone isomerase